MNLAQLRGKVILSLVCATAACGVWEDVAAAQRRTTGNTAASARRARRPAAARRARGRNVRRPAASKTRRDAPTVNATRDAGARVGPVGPAVSPDNDGPWPGSAPAQKWRAVEGGVLTSRAISSPPPEYPPLARAARAQGTVSVRIIVDEEGRVISAEAVKGHPLLRQSAAETVLQWRFTPTLLSGQPVKVTGLVTVKYALR